MLISLLISLIVFSTQILNAQTSSSDELYIKSEIQTILSTLSDNLKKNIDSSIDLLEKSKDLIIQLKKK